MSDRKEYLKKYRLEHKEKYREYQRKYRGTHLSTYEKLQQENQKYKEVIDKAIDYVENGDLLYLANKCSVIYRDNVEVVSICDRLNELLTKLKEVE